MGRFIFRCGHRPGGSGRAMIKHFTSFCIRLKRSVSLLKGVGLHTIAIHNSVPSRGPLAPANPWRSRLKWRIAGTAFWSCAEVLYKVTGGRMVWAPSFELIAQRRQGIAVSRSHWFSLRGRRAIRFLGIVVVLCLLAAVSHVRSAVSVYLGGICQAYAI